MRLRYSILRAVLIVILVVFILGAVSFWAGPMAGTTYIAIKTPPLAKIAPVPLPDSSVSQSPGKKLSYFGCDFEVPWTDVDESQTKVSPGPAPTEVFFVFRSGLRFSVTLDTPLDLVNTATHSFHLSPQDMRAIYGDEAVRSDYAFSKKLYEFTPSQMHHWSLSRRLHFQEYMLILVKSVVLTPSANGGIFYIQNQTFRGFQQGNPRLRPDRITVDLYSDKRCIEFIFSQKDYRNPSGVSQAEINRVVQSLSEAVVKVEEQK
jgi:hypothetical protein